MIDTIKKIKIESTKLMGINEQTRVQALESIATALHNNKDLIIEENKKDLKEATENNLSSALVDRLELNISRIDSMIKGVQEIAQQGQVVGLIESENKRDDGLIIQKQRIPLGVALMIFESRPNVVVDCAALAIKSGNAIILKGGKEAKHSNKALGNIIQEAIAPFLPKESITTLDSTNREAIAQLLELKDYIDIVIPRGGERLIEYVYNNSKIPVIAHFKGLCHVYIDEDCDHQKALDIIINAKTQRTGVCNAMETLIIHESQQELLTKAIEELKKKQTQIKLDPAFKLSGYDEATTEDWDTEYLENILSIKSASSIHEAIEHIKKYGSQHTEAIVSSNSKNIELFTNSVDASCIMINASTRFNDGGELGLGAELGISTTKLHSYGPMGAKEMTTLRHIVKGDGHIRS